jgi:excisionase family DNA binding protein
MIGLLPTILTVVEEIRRYLESRRKDYYTVDEVAELTGRKPYTVRTWIKEKRIEASRIDGTGPKGRLLIARSQLQSLIETGLGGQLRDDLVD